MADTATDLQHLEWEPCLLPRRPRPKIEAYARRELGGVPPALRILGGNEWLARGLVEIESARRVFGHLDLDLADALVLIVSRDNSCRYCYAVQRAMLHIHGLSTTRIRQLEERVNSTARDDPAAAAMRFARKVSRSAPQPEAADAAALQAAGYSLPAIKEMAVTVAGTVLANRAATIVAAPPFRWERLPGHFGFRLVSPLLRWLLRRSRRRATELATPPAYAGPSASIVEALGTLPSAAVLASLFRGAWTSPVLPDRSKALIFAVIARGLNCPLSLADAREVLAREQLDEETVDEVLNHLSGEALSADERVLVPFARDTIWYTDPARLQRRAHEIRDAVGPEKFVEAVGCYALANAVCRLAIVTRIA